MKKSLLIIFNALGIILSSCNLPGNAPAAPDMMTAAALTVQAALATTPLASPSAGVESTPTYSKPMVSVSEVTNCRSGPDKGYERIMQLMPGDQAEIVGFYPPNYWLVNTKQGTCWLFAQFATPVGSFQAVPTVTAPPTPTGTAPAAPTFRDWNFLCNNTGQTDITLNWNDKANNENGYRVLRNGEVAAELPPDSTYYAETITLLSGQSVGYQIQAYNLIGQSNSSIATMTCP